MKSKILSLTLVAGSLISTSVFSQKSVETTAALDFRQYGEALMKGDAELAKKKLIKAKESIDIAAAHADTKESAKTLYYKGEIYSNFLTLGMMSADTNFMKLAGDLVIEQFLELNLVDLNTTLNIKRPEINKLLKNTEVDVCTFTYGVFPLVYKLAYRKTIFICMLPNKKDYYICGVANPMIVSGFSDKNLVLSNTLRDNKRAGFFGFSRLTPLSNNINNFMRIIS